MSDFFSNLAGRLLGVSEVVRPRLPALFETPEREAKLSVEDAGPAHAAPFSEPDDPPEPAAPAAIASRSAPLDFGPRDRPEKAVAQWAPEAAALSPPKPSPPLERPPAKRKVAREKAETKSALEAHHERRGEPRPTNRKTERAATSPPQAETPEPIAKREDQAPTGPKPTPTTTPAAGSPFALPPAPRVSAKRPEAQPRGSEPTIHVSIGRVEIRATREQQSPRREKESSPVMSLDDYLRSRPGRRG